MQFVFSVRDALQIKAVIKKHMHRANSDCAMGVWLLSVHSVWHMAWPGTGVPLWGTLHPGVPKGV